MLIRAIKTSDVDKLGRRITRTTNFGKYKGLYLTVDNLLLNGQIKEKRWVFFNDKLQIIHNKVRNSKGGFDFIG